MYEKLYLDLKETKTDNGTQKKAQTGKYLLSQLLSVQKQWHIILEHLKVNTKCGQSKPYHHRVFLKQCLWNGSCGKSIHRSHPDDLIIVWTPSAVMFPPLKKCWKDKGLKTKYLDLIIGHKTNNLFFFSLVSTCFL